MHNFSDLGPTEQNSLFNSSNANVRVFKAEAVSHNFTGLNPVVPRHPPSHTQQNMMFGDFPSIPGNENNSRFVGPNISDNRAFVWLGKENQNMGNVSRHNHNMNNNFSNFNQARIFSPDNVFSAQNTGIYENENLRATKYSDHQQNPNFPKGKYPVENSKQNNYRSNQKNLKGKQQLSKDRSHLEVRKFANVRATRKKRSSNLPKPVTQKDSPLETNQMLEPSPYAAQAPNDKWGHPPSFERKPPVYDKMAFQWSEILGLLKADCLEAAYRKVLEMGDDLYLLRLMIKTGNCLLELSVGLQRRISERILTFQNLEYL